MNVNEIINGLSQPQKQISSKYLYDEKGSQLFEKICELDEYYVTRTELGILRQHSTDIATLIGPNATIIEPGSGAGEKIQLLLNELTHPKVFILIDIAKS